MSTTVHIIGDRPKGYKHKEIESKSKCKINLSRYNSKNQTPMIITITTNIPNAFNDLRIAKRMITKSLIEFISDPSSERRLLYDLAAFGTGTYSFCQTQDGIVQQECNLTNKLVWMKLLLLPLSNSDGVLKPHGIFLLKPQCKQNLIGNARCSIEVYGFDNLVLQLSNPYVLISGSSPREVGQVMEAVSLALNNHMQKCEFCKFYDNYCVVEEQH